MALGEAIVEWGMWRMDTYVVALVQGWETVLRMGRFPMPFSSTCDPGVSHSETALRTCRSMALAVWERWP